MKPASNRSNSPGRIQVDPRYLDRRRKRLHLPPRICINGAEGGFVHRTEVDAVHSPLQEAKICEMASAFNWANKQPDLVRNQPSVGLKEPAQTTRNPHDSF